MPAQSGKQLELFPDWEKPKIVFSVEKTRGFSIDWAGFERNIDFSHMYGMIPDITNY